METHISGVELRSIIGSDGSVVVGGQPGAWQFSLAKEGYQTINLRYVVIRT